MKMYLDKFYLVLTYRSKLYFHIPYVVLFYRFRLKIIGHGNLDNI
jgi:hypothetical protein